MRIAICDDDKKCNIQLRKMLENYAKRREIDKIMIEEYTSGLCLVDGYEPDLFDFIFLDVEMPKLDGFDTAQKIREVDLDVDTVFVTYMKSDVQRGFDYNAKGYLYKNVTQEQIDERMDKLIDERLRNKKISFRKIKIKNKGTGLLSLTRTQYFESQNHDIIAASEKEKHIFIDTITNLANELADKGFVQISQTHLVNIEHVFYVKGYKVTIKKGKDELTVGRAYKQVLMDAIDKREANKWNYDVGGD